MKFCKSCNERMIGVISFKGKDKEKFDMCPNCHFETKHKELRSDELDFGEVEKEMYKRK